MLPLFIGEKAFNALHVEHKLAEFEQLSKQYCFIFIILYYYFLD